MKHLIFTALFFVAFNSMAQRWLMTGPSDTSEIQHKLYFDPRNGDVFSDGQFIQLGAANMFYPWVGLVLGAGTITESEGETNHPWIANVSCAASATTGARFILGTQGEQLDAGKLFSTVFKVQNTPNTQGKHGWMDSFTQIASIDAAYLWQTNGLIYGYTSSNYVYSITSTALTFPTTAWMRGQIKVESDTVIRYSVFSGGGTLLWTDTTTNNIPLGPGRSVGIGNVIYTTGTTAQSLVLVDLFERLNPPLIR